MPRPSWRLTWQLLLAANERMNLVSAAAARAGGARRAAPLRTRSRGCRSSRPRPERRIAFSTSAREVGFPALPLLLVRRDLEGTLVESTGKKARFLAEVLRSALVDGHGRER